MTSLIRVLRHSRVTRAITIKIYFSDLFYFTARLRSKIGRHLVVMLPGKYISESVKPGLHEILHNTPFRTEPQSILPVYCSNALLPIMKN